MRLAGHASASMLAPRPRRSPPAPGARVGGGSSAERRERQPLAREEDRARRRRRPTSRSPAGRARTRTRSSRGRRTGRAVARRPPASGRSSPARAGRSLATFISSSTRPAAGSGAWMSNARMATYTAKSCSVQPRHWSRIAPAAGAGAFNTESPCRAIPSRCRTVSAPSSDGRCAAARAHRRRRQQREARSRRRRAGSSPPSAGSSPSRGRSRSRAAPGRGRTDGARRRCPTSAAHVPRPCGRRRRSTATRASSPIRPGSTAFPSSPTEKAENVRLNGGSGGSSACTIVSCQASAAYEHRQAG